jgi:hypothetical protein
LYRHTSLEDELVHGVVGMPMWVNQDIVIHCAIN